jgi:hypothetical protein
MVADVWRRTGENALLTWRWFGYWRRRYMWLRIAVLALLFAQPVYYTLDPLVVKLVRIAIIGIEHAKPGPYHHARALQFREKKRLQKSLLARFDGSRDGRLSRAEAGRLEEATGLTAAQVEGSALQVELDPLVDVPSPRRSDPTASPGERSILFS